MQLAGLKNILDYNFEIEPILYSNLNEVGLIDFTISMQKLVKSIILNNFKRIEDNIFSKLQQLLPIFDYSDISSAPFLFRLSFLCLGDFTHGVGRFITDMLNKWLIPGKSIAICGQRSIEFKFKESPENNYYIAEYFININSEKESNLIKRNISSFIEEMKLIILSVQKARRINAIDRLNEVDKSNLIQENLTNLFDKSLDNMPFHQVKDFIYKISEEKKLSQIKENLAYLMHKKPNLFDRNIFDSVHSLSLMFKGDFTEKRSHKHISKIIALQYLFKKSIQQIISSTKIQSRIVHLKLLKTNIIHSDKMSLGILICMNLLNEKEYFDKRYVMDAISSLVNDVKYVEDSYLIDHRDDKLISFYLEIEKNNLSGFSQDEIDELKEKLPNEFKQRINSVVNPIFLPRNEEEILRNIIVLSKQLKFVRDLPQVIISYEQQSQKEVSFNIIILRLLEFDTKSLKEIFSYSKTFLKANFDETKIVGFLKKKHPKEANVFRVSLNKFDFLRRDYSLDLTKARKAVSEELTKIIGEYRDFNGGMLIKQTNALEHLKNMMSSLKKPEEFLLENFFYSIRPGIMQSILHDEVLKKFFLMFLNVSKNLKNNQRTVETDRDVNYYYVMIATINKKLKEQVILAINKLKIKSFDLISSSLDTNELNTLGYLFREDNEEKTLNIKKIIFDALGQEDI